VAGPPSEAAVDQAKVVAFLSEGRAFGLADQPVERIDTHAATVFLIGDRAYKLKRAVRYSFLDFSTIEQRHCILDDEYHLNIRTAPDLYRRLIPVTCDDRGHLALEGDGRIVDWLLEMKRFDQSALLDHLAEKGSLDAALIDALAREVASLHEMAPVRDGGGHQAMAAIVDGNAGDLEQLTGDLEAGETITSLSKAIRAELAEQRELLDQRARNGFVRHCHGDLHLGNIFLDGQRPVLFDCLEFDETLATIDVFYDLAFLLMDLCHRGLSKLAIDLLNAYLDRTEDDEGTATLQLFLTIRATIRAKIEGFEIKTSGKDEERVRHRAAALDYLGLAGKLLLAGPPRLIAIGGLSGTGKSTVARLLAHKLGRQSWPVILRSDVLRKRLSGVEPTARLDAKDYGRSVSADVYQRLRDRASILLRAGRTVIADATFLDPVDREAIEDLASDVGVPFQGVWLEAPRAILERRIERRHGDASDATVEVLAKQYERDLGKIRWTVMDASIDAHDTALSVQALLLE
jgi:aminoglycoside phosphotransferase family enzyme/predicted kinase